MAPSNDDRGLGGDGDHDNSGQPRVPAGDPSGHGGRWTRIGGASLASSAAPAVAPQGFGLSFAETAAAARQALARLLALGAAAPAGALGGALAGILIPSNGSNVSDGVVPGFPDVRFYYDEGLLILGWNLPRGETRLLFHGMPDLDGTYRTPAGIVIGHWTPEGVVLNEAALGRTKTRAATLADAATAKDQVKYCPDPVPDRASNDNIRWQLYQMQISKLPRGIAVELNGVMFDGCDEIRKRYLEAKGEGLAWAIEGDDFRKEYWGRAQLVRQMHRQSEAAREQIVEWHVAEARVAEVLRKIARDEGLRNIIVIHTPPVYDHGDLK